MWRNTYRCWGYTFSHRNSINTKLETKIKSKRSLMGREWEPQTKHCEIQKQSWKLLLSSLALFCWAWGLPLNMICIPSETPLWKTNFSFVSRYQLKTAFGLGMGLVSISPLSSWTLSGLDLCRPCTCCAVTVSEFVCISPIVSGRPCLPPWCFHPPGSFSLSTSSFAEFSELWEEEIHGDNLSLERDLVVLTAEPSL